MAGMRTLEEIMRLDGVGPVQAKKIQDQEILDLYSNQQTSKKKAQDDSRPIPPPEPTPKTPPIRYPNGQFVRQKVPTQETINQGHIGDRSMSDMMVDKQPVRNPPNHQAHGGDTVDARTVSHNLADGSEQMPQTMFKKFVDNDIGREEQKRDIQDKTKGSMKDLQQRNLFMFLSHGFVKESDKNMDQAVKSMDTVLDKYHSEKNKTPEKLIRTQEEINKLIKESTIGQKGQRATKQDSDSIKVLRSIEKYTALNSKLLYDLVGGGKTRRERAPKPNFSLFGGRSKSSLSKDDLNLLSSKPTASKDTDSGGHGVSGLVAGALGGLGLKLGGSILSVLGTGLMALAPTFATAFATAGAATLAAAIVGAAYSVIKGLGDSTKVRERQGQLESTDKEARVGEQTVSAMPTNIKNIFDSDPDTKKQFDEAKDDDDRRNLLYSHGASKEDIEAAIKSAPRHGLGRATGAPGVVGKMGGAISNTATSITNGATNITNGLTNLFTQRPTGTQQFGNRFSDPGSSHGINRSATPLSSGSGKMSTGTITDSAIPDSGKALLDTIASHESGGDYNIRQGGGHLNDLSQHPGRPGPGGISSAAGKYQFIKGTWDEASQALGLKDFSPDSQDKAAWWLAKRDYKAHTGRDLTADSQSKDPKVQLQIAQALHNTWTSMPGGYDPGLGKGGRQSGEYLATLNSNLNKYDGDTNSTTKVAGDKTINTTTASSTTTSIENEPLGAVKEAGGATNDPSKQVASVSTQTAPPAPSKSMVEAGSAMNASSDLASIAPAASSMGAIEPPKQSSSGAVLTAAATGLANMKQATATKSSNINITQASQPQPTVSQTTPQPNQLVGSVRDDNPVLLEALKSDLKRA